MLIRNVDFMGDCSMKKFGFVFALLSTTLLWAAPDKPNPADFMVKVHVVSSGSLWVGGVDGHSNQVLETVIENQLVELQTDNAGVLALGDYSGRLSPAVRTPKHPNSYDIYRSYDLLMPDGTTRTYYVTRFGPALSIH
jgi:hypothetical protein